MSQEIINPIQNISYTSKDFETVYPEILDLVKTLTYKWDPSISNESDPGVILIKLLAILEDKCNYNIDKNILEAFPISVTQNTNARQLFAQLGYFMHWYNSATTNVTVKWIGSSATNSYTIPAFTMVSDDEATVVYTLVGPSANTSTATFNVGSQKLKLDGTELSFKAIQGVAVNYDVSGNTLITYDYLDSNNRLYFDTIDIAENGIFICNNGQNNYKVWERKDNLLVEPLGNYYYKFGVTSDASKCYIEFPSDAEKLFQEGINITYIKTDGSNGNVAARVLSKFYNDLIPAEDDSVTLNSTNVQIYNPSSGVSGEDPQDIDDAYNDYMHTVGTFETLITLRDYINAIYETELASNNFVCDRTNDIQSVYKIQATVDDLDQEQTIVEQVKAQKTTTEGSTVTVYEPTLNAYDLKLYLLQPSTDLTTISGYWKTFKPMTDAQSSNIKAVIDDLKSIQHDYQDILPTNSTQSHFCYFINAYPVNWTVKTQYAVSNNIWESEILVNIKEALFKNLNAHEISFGEAINPDYLYNVIINADKRIKTVYKSNIDYKTYAVYYDGTSYKNVLINPEYFKDSVSFESTSSELSAKIDYETYVNKIGSRCDYKERDFTYDGSNWKYADAVISLADYGITLSGSPATNDIITTRISIANQFRDEIYIKSVLAGKTQFFVKDELFDYQLNQSMISFLGDTDEDNDKIKEVGGNATIQISNTLSNTGNYELKTNETIRLYAPNLISDTTYSDYVRMSFYADSTIEVASGASYELQENQYVTFYWKESTDSLYSYACYGKGNIICPSFKIVSSNSLDTFPTTIKSLLVDLEEGNSTYTRYGLSGMTTSAQSEFVSNYLTSDQNGGYVLSGNKSATIKKANEITLNKKNGYYCYWITENYRTDDNNVNHYILFEDGEDEKILNYNEYFLYANSTLTNMIALGVGSKIKRNSTSGEWSVVAVDASDILETGTSFLTDNDAWFNITGDNELYLIENQFSSVSTGYKFNLKPIWTDTTYSNWMYEFNKNGSYGIRYSLSNTSGSAPVVANWELEKLINYVGSNTVFTYSSSDSLWHKGSDTITNGELSSRYGITVNSPVAGDTVTVIAITLADFDISYVDLSNVTTNIDPILSTIGTWDGNSILNIYIDYDDEMQLLSNQTITFVTAGGEEIVITGEDAVSPTSGACYYPVVLLSSIQIKNNTTSTIPCYTVNTESVSYPIIYQYKKYFNNALGDNNISYTSDGTVLLTFNHSTTESTVSNSFKFNLPASTSYNDEKVYSADYILGLVNNYVEDVEELEVVMDAGTSIEKHIHPMYSDSISDFSDQNIYYLYLPLSGFPYEQTFTSQPIGQRTFDVDHIIHAVTSIKIGSTVYTGEYTVSGKQVILPKMTITEVSDVVINYTSIDTEHTLTISMKNPAETKNFILYNPYKYKKPVVQYRPFADEDDNPIYMNDKEFGKYRELINRFDIDNVFNYTYEVDSDIELSRPCEAESFNSSNHIFNPFTICAISEIDKLRG